MKLKKYITGKRLAKEQKAQGYLKYDLMLSEQEIINKLNELYGEDEMKTRQELINLFDSKFHTLDSNVANKWIDFFIEAGIIEVKKEETIEDKIRRVFAGRLIKGHNELMNYLQNNNLKIVEK